MPALCIPDNARDKLVYDPPGPGCILSLTGRPGGGSTLLDNSPYGNNGTIAGATWAKTPGGLDCLSFDGVDDYVQRAVVKGLPAGNHQISAEIWFKAGKIDSRQIFLQTGNQALNTGLVFDLQANNTIKTSFHEGGAITSSLTVDLGSWYHLVFVYNLAKNYQFINGGNEKSVNYNSAAMSGTILDLGCYSPSSYSIKGLIALLRIYNYALSAFEARNFFKETILLVRGY